MTIYRPDPADYEPPPRDAFGRLLPDLDWPPDDPDWRAARDARRARARARGQAVLDQLKQVVDN